MKRGFIPKYYDISGITPEEFCREHLLVNIGQIKRLTDNSFRVYLTLQDKRSCASRLWSSITGLWRKHD